MSDEENLGLIKSFRYFILNEEEVKDTEGFYLSEEDTIIEEDSNEG